MSRRIELAIVGAALLLVAACTRPAAVPARPDVFVFLVDTLRADHLGTYGYPKPVSPAIDRFAHESTLFLRGRAQCSWTRPAVAALLTGYYPPTIQVEEVADRLPPQIETLASRLRAAGYQTSMVTTNTNDDRQFGFAKGFDLFRHLGETGARKEFFVNGFAAVDAAVGSLDRLDLSRPVFAVVHVSDPHAPYAPQPEYLKRFAPGVDPDLGSVATLLAMDRGERPVSPAELSGIVALYDASVAQVDAAFDRFLGELRRRKLYEQSVVVFVADHGEEFLEHGHLQHGRSLYEDQLRIPFIVRLPGGRAADRRIDAVADQVDLVPTMMDLLGLSPDATLPGRSLLPFVDGATPGGDRASLAFVEQELRRWDSAMRNEAKLIVLETPERWKNLPPLQLYDLANDRLEARNLATERIELRDRLFGDLRAALARFPPLGRRSTVKLSDETVAKLRALGYLR